MPILLDLVVELSREEDFKKNTQILQIAVVLSFSRYVCFFQAMGQFTAVKLTPSLTKTTTTPPTPLDRDLTSCYQAMYIPTQDWHQLASPVRFVRATSHDKELVSSATVALAGCT